MVIVPEQEVEATLKDALDNRVERGVFMRCDIGKEAFKHFSLLKDRGYFPVGMILEDGNNVEFIFQRHDKQTKQMKMVEMKIPKSERLKL